MSLFSQLYQKIEAAGLWQEERVLQRGEFLAREGSSNTHLYYVVSGSLRVYVLDEQEEHTVRFGYGGSFITALDSFITDGPTQYYVQALKKTNLKAIAKASYRQFLQSSEEHLQLWQKLLEQLVYQQMERERDLLTSSPLERYRRVLARSPQLFQQIPHKYIASYLRMTPETLSRLKKS